MILGEGWWRFLGHVGDRHGTGRAAQKLQREMLMKIMATFDGSAFAESTLPLLERMARLPDAEFVLLSVTQEPHGQRGRDRIRRPIAAVLGGGVGGGAAIVIQPPRERYAEGKVQAVQRQLDEAATYLYGLVSHLPSGPAYSVETHVSHDPAATIIERSLVEQPDVIVMATHGRTGLAHMLFGSVAERVVHSGVAPVLLVHPEAVVHARAAGVPLGPGAEADPAAP